MDPEPATVGLTMLHIVWHHRTPSQHAVLSLGPDPIPKPQFATLFDERFTVLGGTQRDEAIVDIIGHAGF